MSSEKQNAKRSATRRAALLGAGAAAFSTAAHAQLPFRIPDNLQDALNGNNNNNSNQQQQPQQPQSPILSQTGANGLQIVGYALAFTPVRDLIAAGSYPQALSTFTSGGSQGTTLNSMLSRNDEFLSNVETGVMNFDATQWPPAKNNFLEAHNFAERQRNRRGGLLGSIGGAFGAGLAPYRQRDYERVLQLNYLSMSFLVDGERRSYNAARQAVAEQANMQRQFAEEIAQAEQNIRQQNASPQASQGGTVQMFQILEDLQAFFAQFSGASDRVPSAYVNPIGHYVNAAIYEITSSDRPTLRDNARLAYQAALQLVGSSPQLSSAVSAMEQPATGNDRVLHVVVGEGFAPSRQALTFGVSLNNQIVPVKLPIFKPNDSEVTHVDVADSRGRPIARLDAMGDIEAMVMRDQADRVWQYIAGVAVTTLRASGVQDVRGSLPQQLGDLGGSFAEFTSGLEDPDMRSWSSLPRRFHIGRIPLSAGTQELRIRSFAGRRMLSQQTIRVTPDLTHAVAYGRAVDRRLGVEQPRRLWIDDVNGV